MQQSSQYIPKHVAIIPDGNRRWARERGLDPWIGHEEGAKNTESIIKKASELGIRCLTLWGSSMNNMVKRPLKEKKALFRIYEEYFQKMLHDETIHEKAVKVSLMGRWREQFPETLKNTLEKLIEKTKNYDQYHLNFLLAYNGDEEMLSAVRGIVRAQVDPENIDESVIKKHLYTASLPPVDYLIRTGGDPHLSVGFMMWDIADAQLYFSEKYYPDFDASIFEESIREYQRRERRHGK